MVVEGVTSQIADGDIERVVRYGNRAYVLELYVEGPTLGSLAESEALLRSELRRTGLLLTHDPGDALTPVSVYEVQTAQLTPQRRDDHESHLLRKFTLTLTCAPFARSANPVTLAALPSGGAAAVVDTCDSTTGWSTGITANSDTLSVSGGAVWSTDTSGNDAASLYRPAAIDVSSYPYFVLEWKATPSAIGILVIGMPAAAPQFPSELRRAALPDGWYRSTWAVEPGDLASGFQLSFSGSGVTSLGIREVSVSGAAPGTGARQLTRIIETGGTERTPASIHVASTTGVDGLGGLAIVHTSPEDGSGYSPPLRRWRTSASTGPETVDASALSGKWEDIAYVSGGFYAEVPTSALPEGGYVLMARIRSATAPLNQGTLYWSTSTIFPDTTTQQGFTNGNIDYAVGGTDPLIFPIAALSLPSVRTRSGKVQIVLQAITSSGPQVQLDEAWLFRADDDCALTIVRSFQPDLWLDSPDLSSPVPRVWIGDGRDLQVHPAGALDALGNHVLSPDGTSVFTAALTDNPATDVTFYRRWHSNAAE